MFYHPHLRTYSSPNLCRGTIWVASSVRNLFFLFFFSSLASCRVSYLFRRPLSAVQPATTARKQGRTPELTCATFNCRIDQPELTIDLFFFIIITVFLFLSHPRDKIKTLSGVAFYLLLLQTYKNGITYGLLSDRFWGLFFILVLLLDARTWSYKKSYTQIIFD